MTISITFRALTTPKLRYSSSAIINGVSQYMESFLNGILDEVREYPPVPVNSTYERTYLLFDSWRVTRAQMSGRGLGCALVNTAPYAAFVQGDFQTHVHQSNGWIKVRNITQQRRGEYRAGIQKIIRDNIGW